MAKLQLLPLFVAAFCLAVAGVAVAVAPSTVTVEGRVYCDTCRAGFETSLTKYIEGAKVKLECKHFDTGKVSFSVEAVTDATGTYKVDAGHDHDEDICEVVVLESSDATCSEVQKGRDRARVVLSNDSGIASAFRYANPLGFLAESPLPECGVLLQKYALGDEEEWA